MNYPGNCTPVDPDHVMGPDMFGAYYVPKSAHYDADADITRMELRPLPPAELQERVTPKLAERVRLLRMFKAA